MKLFIVVVNFRVPQLTIDCLQSVAAEITGFPDLKVGVCENGSGDNSHALIRRAIDESGWSSWCRLTVSPVNLGFTGGNNAVIRPVLDAAQPPDYVLLLNPDTIVRPNALNALVEFMDANPTVGIAGSRLEDLDGTPQRSAFRFQTPLGIFENSLRLGLASRLLNRWTIAPPVVDHATQTDWVSGASMMVRRTVFEEIGLLDEGLFTYYDDIDLCHRAKAKGWTTWYVPSSHVVHLVGQSSGIDSRKAKRLPSYVLDARRRYFLKNCGPLYTAIVDACAIVGLSLGDVKDFLTGKQNNIPPHLLIDSISNSVFAKGFRVPTVKNPALTSKSPPA